MGHKQFNEEAYYSQNYGKDYPSYYHNPSYPHGYGQHSRHHPGQHPGPHPGPHPGHHPRHHPAQHPGQYLEHKLPYHLEYKSQEGLTNPKEVEYESHVNNNYLATESQEINIGGRTIIDQGNQFINLTTTKNKHKKLHEEDSISKSSNTTNKSMKINHSKDTLKEQIITEKKTDRFSNMAKSDIEKYKGLNNQKLSQIKRCKRKKGRVRESSHGSESE